MLDGPADNAQNDGQQMDIDDGLHDEIDVQMDVDVELEVDGAKHEKEGGCSNGLCFF